MINLTSMGILRNETEGGYGGESPLPNLENLSFRKAKTAVQCIFTGQLTGSRTI